MGNILGVGASLIWLGLLIHWWKSKSFYPVAGEDRLTKVFWGISFLLFNPLMLALYFVYGVCLHRKERPHRFLIPARIVVFTAFALSILYALHLGQRSNEPRVLTQESRGKSADFSAKATICFAENPASMSGNLGFETMNYLDMHRIAILNQSDDPLAVTTARMLQRWLLNHPEVEEVAYYPRNTHPDEGRRLPSLYIEIDLDHGKNSPLPLARNIRADITFRISTLQSLTSPWLPLPVSAQCSTISIQHQSSVIGYESFAAKYDTAAESILNALFAYIKGMSGTWYASALVPALPEYALGSYTPTPSMPFDENECIRKISGYDLLTHNQTTWWLEDSRSPEEALGALRDSLIEGGWQDFSSYSDAVLLKRGEESLSIAVVGDSPKKGKVILTACYRNPCTAAETDQVLAKLLDDSRVTDDTLLFFGRQFRETTSPALADRFKDRMGEAKPVTLAAQLELARCWENQGEVEKARRELLLAAANQYLNLSDDSTGGIIQDLAGRLGNEEMVNALPTEAMLQSLGLVPLADISTNLTMNVNPGKPFGFYVFQDDDNRQSAQATRLRTYVFKIIRDPFAPAGSPASPETDPCNWALTNFERSTGGAQTWSVTGGSLSNNLWSASWSRGMPDPINAQTRLDIRQTDNEAFSITIKPLPPPAQLPVSL